jgi:hypothetical protein
MSPEKGAAGLLILMVLLLIFKEEHRARRIRKEHQKERDADVPTGP